MRNFYRKLFYSALINIFLPYFCDLQFFIKGLSNLNRVVQNDAVAIEVLPKHKWTCPSSLIEVDDNVDPEAVNSLESVRTHQYLSLLYF